MKLFSILVCIAAYVFANRALTAAIHRLGKAKQVAEVRVTYLTKTARLALFVLFVFAVCLVLGLGYGDVSLFLSSAFAVIGVALFAQWSLLSNITASMVIFFGFPYRVGDQIKVTDSDFDLSGTVVEISLFHVLIRSAEGHLITYPNNLILQKPVIKRGKAPLPQKLFPPQPARPEPRLMDRIRESSARRRRSAARREPYRSPSSLKS